MHRIPSHITVRFRADLAELQEKAKRLAVDLLAADNQFLSIGVANPGGVETFYPEHYRVGDFISHIGYADDPHEKFAFRLTFSLRSDAPNSFWKDMIVRTIRILEEVGVRGEIVRSTIALPCD